MIASLMFKESLCGLDFLIMARIRPMTSPARLPSRIMRSMDLRAASRLGASPASQRKQALPLLTSPVSGWFTS